MASQLVLSVLLLSHTLLLASAFELPKFFGGTPKKVPGLSSVSAQKKSILDAISFTGNGKNATPEQQAQVLQLVRTLEKDAPPSPQLLTDPQQAKILDGAWYLQYTSPSEIEGSDEFPDAWKPNNVEPDITTKAFEAKGSVSAAGIEVDTSNRVVKQSLDVASSRVTNDVALDWGRVVVGGSFRPSTRVPNRAVVAFDMCEITLNNGLVLNLGFLFSIVAFIRRTAENGWLETTFVDNEMRIGRGNKGTMFVLTRDPNAVKP